MPIKDALFDFSKSIHREWDEIVDRLNWGVDKPIVVANYGGFGREDYLYLKGRVLRDKAISRAERDGLLRNVINNFKRFNSREVPGAEVEIHWGDQVFWRTTDAEGYFVVEEQFDAPIALDQTTSNWQEAKVIVNSVPGQIAVDFHSFAPVQLPSKCEFGIISDIDDTVLQTDVTSKLMLKAMWHTIVKNAGNRRAFSEVAEFYQALQLGIDGKGENPMFYLSNSPWNLYDLLTDFLSINHLPKGNVLLRDFGLPYEDKPEDYQGHKVDMLEKILSTYPDIPFILLGDSGEKDTDIYLTVAKKFGHQIQQIYIRDVQHQRRANRIKSLIEKHENIPVRLIANYQEAKEHAIGKGYII